MRAQLRPSFARAERAARRGHRCPGPHAVARDRTGAGHRVWLRTRGVRLSSRLPEEPWGICTTPRNEGTSTRPVGCWIAQHPRHNEALRRCSQRPAMSRMWSHLRHSSCARGGGLAKPSSHTLCSPTGRRDRSALWSAPTATAGSSRTSAAPAFRSTQGRRLGGKRGERRKRRIGIDAERSRLPRQERDHAAERACE